MAALVVLVVNGGSCPAWASERGKPSGAAAESLSDRIFHLVLPAMMCENVVQGDIPLPLWYYYYYYYFDLHTMCVGGMAWSGLVPKHCIYDYHHNLIRCVCFICTNCTAIHGKWCHTLEGVCSVAHKTCEMLCTGFMIRQIQKEDTKENVFLFNCCHGYTLTYYSSYYYWQHVLHPHFNLITLTLNYHQHTMRRRSRRRRRRRWSRRRRRWRMHEW